MAMKWSDRPPEVAYSLNPAFCGRVIDGCIAGYAAAACRAMPYPLSYLILPIVLHKRTRDSMPSTLQTRMHPWLSKNQRAKIGFDERVRSMAQFTREALIFLIRTGKIEVTGAGELAGGDTKATRNSKSESPEIVDCAKKAKIVGKWFAPYADAAEVFRMWGVAP